MDSHTRLRQALTEGAATLDLPGAGPEAVRERAARRTRRTRAAQASLTALVLVAGGVTAWQVLPADGRNVGLESSAAAASDTAAPLDLTWREVDGLASYSRDVIVGDDGRYYALSTAPGTRWEDHPDGAIPQAIYRSADGVTWEVAEQGEDPWIVELGERGGVLYALSTAPTTAGTGSGQIGVSTDGGTTWQRADLPSAAAQPPATVPLHQPSIAGDLAVGSDLMLASVRTTWWIDETALFTPEELEAGWPQPTAEGLTLMHDPCLEQAIVAEPTTRGTDDVDVAPVPAEVRACEAQERTAVRTVPWADMGLTGAQDLRSEELFASTDGVNWQRLESPFDGRYLLEFTATAGGFVAVVEDYDPTTETSTTSLLRSSDGVTWEELAAPAAYTNGYDVIGGRLVTTVSTDGQELLVMTSDDGGTTWSTTDLTGVVNPDGAYVQLWGATLDASDLGAAAIVIGSDAQGRVTEHHLLTSADGVTWSAQPLAGIVGAEPFGVGWLAVGPNSVGFAVTFPSQAPDGTGPYVTRTFVGTPTA